MGSPRRLLWILFATALLFTSALHLSTPGARAASGSQRMEHYDLGVSWESPWSLSTFEATKGQFDLIELQYGDHDIYEMFYGLPWTESSSEEVTKRFVEEFLTDKPAYTKVQDWSRGGASGPFPEIISYEEGGQVWQQRVTGFPLGDGKNSYAWVIRIAEDPDPFEFREWSRLISVDFPSTFGNGSIAANPTPTVDNTAGLQDAQRLANLLRTSPFADDELSGYCCPSLEADSGATEPISVFFNLSGPGNALSLGYWIFSSPEAAATNYRTTMVRKQQDFPAMLDATSYMGAPATVLGSSDWRVAGCYVLVDNVVFVGSVVGVDAPYSSADTACELARYAVIHLVKVTGG